VTTRSVLGFVALGSLAGAASPQDAPPPAGEARPEITVSREVSDVPKTLTAAEAKPALERYLRWLVVNQKPTGAWGTGVLECYFEQGFEVETYYAWQVAAHGLACMALMEAEETPERRAALERALDWLATTRMPKRGSHWDVDNNWSTLYGLVACVRAMDDPRVAGERRARLEARGKEFLASLAANQVPEGGWAYYDDPPFTRRPTWSTSFCTALILPTLARAKALGWTYEPRMLARAQEYVKRCALPNGAYEYDLRPIPRVSAGEHINNVKGSLGRIQVCNWGLAASGEGFATPDRIRRGLEAFFEEHRFLDVARMRPIPHEGYYANAGYFYYFGHYYAALAIEQLPLEEREPWHARLRPHLIKAQREDGSTSDFLDSTYMITASTSYAALALQLGMPERRAAR
jgi:hypothetical protein